METPMPPAVPISDDIFSAFLKCKYKAYLKLAAQAGETSDYERLEIRLTQQYRAEARSRFVEGLGGAAAFQSPPSLGGAIRGGPEAPIHVALGNEGGAARLDATRRVLGGRGPAAAEYEPVLFVRGEGVRSGLAPPHFRP